jgi:hypothetical protein
VAQRLLEIGEPKSNEPISFKIPKLRRINEHVDALIPVAEKGEDPAVFATNTLVLRSLILVQDYGIYLLGVSTSHVVQLGKPSSGRLVSKGAVRSAPVIEIQPAR